MDDALFRQRLQQLTKEELLSQWSNKKPHTTFSDATFDDCVNKDGLGLDVSNVLDEVRPSFNIPEDFIAPTPSQWLCDSLLKIHNV